MMPNSRGITTGKRYAGYSEKEQTLIANSIADYGYSMQSTYKEGLGNIGADEIRNYVKQHIEATGNAACSNRLPPNTSPN